MADTDKTVSMAFVRECVCLLDQFCDGLAADIAEANAVFENAGIDPSLNPHKSEVGINLPPVPRPQPSGTGCEPSFQNSPNLPSIDGATALQDMKTLVQMVWTSLAGFESDKTLTVPPPGDPKRKITYASLSTG